MFVFENLPKIECIHNSSSLNPKKIKAVDAEDIFQCPLSYFSLLKNTKQK